MVSPESRIISVPLTIAPGSQRPRSPRRAACLGCGASLRLHQPDDQAPQRLLGTCNRCGRWHLIDCDEAVVVLLPDATTFCVAGAIR